MTTGTISPWPLVRKGDQRHPVKTLQYLLRARGHNVTVDGIVGPNTWSALISTVKQSSQGDAVRGVQEEFQLRNLSGDPSKGLQVDGILAPRPTPPSAASSRPSIGTSRRSPLTASSDQSPGGHW